MTNCSNCKHARKACNPKYIACGYLSMMKRGINAVPPIVERGFYGDYYTKQVDFDEWFNTQVKFEDENEVYSGWACLAVKPESENKGLISNYCIILSKENCCNLYEKE